MSIDCTIPVFKQLIQTYSDWNTLKSYLESEEGGHLRISEPNEKGLVLIRYEKGSSKMNVPHLAWFRSVIWDTLRHLPVSIAPCRASSVTFPYSTLKECNDASMICEEFLDGFMINCFRTEKDGIWQISSRSKLDATGTFYSSKTFRQLFLESYMECNDTSLDELETTFQQRIRHDIVEENDRVSCSFLVQHRDNRIVSPILQNRVILIQKCIIQPTGEVKLYDHFDTFRGHTNMISIPISPFTTKNTYADKVRSGISNENQDIQSWIKEWMNLHTWKEQGIVIKDKEGNRWRFRSDKYLVVKSLRGNHSNALERFSQLYTQNLTQMYLEYYPEETMEWTMNSVCMNQVIQTLYHLYSQLHIVKAMDASQIDKMYLSHLYHLHGIYLSELKPQKKKLTLISIQSYFQKQPWQRIAFLIRKNKESYFQPASI